MLKLNPLEKLFDKLLIFDTIKYNECYFFLINIIFWKNKNSS